MRVDQTEVSCDIKQSPAGNRWAFTIGSTTLALTMIPYLIGYALSNGRHFMWLGYNLDDSCVYLSWLRQAGSHRVLNMFTTEKQHGMEANPLFLGLGMISRILHLPLTFILQSSRLVFAACFLAIVWNIVKTTVNDKRARILAFLFVCFGSGLGWLPGLWPDPSGSSGPSPIDAWQPEAISFLAIYLSPLFAFSLAVQALSAVFFLRAVQTKRPAFAVYSGLCLFVLGLTHTYDFVPMITLFVAFATILALLSRGPTVSRLFTFVAIAGALGMPAVLYVKHELNVESVFHQRMEVPTRSGPFAYLLLGYGILMALALYATYFAVKSIRAKSVHVAENDSAGEARVGAIITDPIPVLMLVVWMIVNIAVSYLPAPQFPFQRKMLQGAHIPIAILAGIGAAMLFRKLRGMDTEWKFLAAAFASTLVLAISNIRFVLRDIDSYGMDLIQTTHMHRPYISQGEIDALHWIENNTPAGSAIQPLPWLAISDAHFRPVDITLACFTPGLTNRPVYCGHWGETPDYAAKLAEMDRIALPAPMMTDEARIDLLKRMRIQYIVFSQKQPEETTLGADADKLLPMFRGNLPLPNYLVKVYSNPDADVYKVQLP